MHTTAKNRSTNRATTTFAAFGLLVGLTAVTTPFPPAAEATWVAAWTAAPDSAGPPVEQQSLRQIARTSIAGSRVRDPAVEPLRRGAGADRPHPGGGPRERVGDHPGTDRPVTFNGVSTVTIAAGAAVLSDPVALQVTALQELAVSLYLPTRAATSTVDSTALQTTFIATRRPDTRRRVAERHHGSQPLFPDRRGSRTRRARESGRHHGRLHHGRRRLHDRRQRPMARRPRRPAAGRSALASIAVVNAGIAGNRILNDGVDPFIGPSSLSRFDRDALDKPGVRWVILLQGSNDISATEMLDTPKDRVTPAQIIAGMQTLIARAHARGIAIWGATMLPRAGVQKPFVTTAAGTAAREAVNTWIRSSGAFDAVIDFERVMGDPDRPDRLLPACTTAAIISTRTMPDIGPWPRPSICAFSHADNTSRPVRKLRRHFAVTGG